MIDRERLRIRLLDILATFSPRAGWEDSPRVERWLDRLMECDLEPREVERLERRVTELKIAFDLEKGVERELEADAMALEDVLRERLSRDVHIVAVETERDELKRRLDAVRALEVDEVLDQQLLPVKGKASQQSVQGVRVALTFVRGIVDGAPPTPSR